MKIALNSLKTLSFILAFIGLITIIVLLLRHIVIPLLLI